MTPPQKIIRLVINKTIVPKQPKRGGRKGYGAVLIVRLLVYSVLVGIFTNMGLKRHLEKHRNSIARVLGFKAIPHRTSIGRWKRKYHMLVFQTLNHLGDLIQSIIPTVIEVVDSTELEDPSDPDARKGKTSKGWFEGFKVHIGINQLRIPLRAVFTSGNKHDSPQLPYLLVVCLYLLGDAGYDSKENRKRVRDVGGIPVIDRNPRNTGKKYKRPWLLKKFRYLVEQFNSLLKNEALNRYWWKVKGFSRKATLVYSAIVAIQVMAIDALLVEIKVYLA
jgi:hypothetical protein